MAKKPASLAAAAVMALLLAGCSTMATGLGYVAQHQALFSAAIQYAVGRVVGDDTDKAERYQSVISAIRPALDAERSVTLAELDAALGSALDAEGISGSDRELVDGMIARAGQYLRSRYGDDPDVEQIVASVQAILDWVDEALQPVLMGQGAQVAALPSLDTNSDPPPIAA